MVWSEKPHRVPLEVDVKYISWEPTGVGKPFKEKPESLDTGGGSQGCVQDPAQGQPQSCR